MVAAPDPLLRIPYLYHFTDVRNLPAIKELGALWSTAKLREAEREFFPGGNDWSLDQDQRTGMHEFVHLCWVLRHPMEWNIRQRDATIRLKYLRIDRQILYEPGVRFSPGVANAVGMGTYSIEEARDSDMIDYEALYGNIGPLYQAGPQARRAAAEQCEILVPDHIPMRLITNFPNG